jgi:DNA repair exonuclease SbcCD ATPase subunit
VTDRSQSVEIQAFEQVLAAPGIALLRVLVAGPRRRSSASEPNLVISDEQGTQRFAPLPAPDDPHGILRVAYSVPVELLERAVTFGLEFQSGGPVILPQPTAGSMRLPARPAQQDSGQSGTAAAEADPDLNEDRRIAIHEKLAQQSQALAESERAATARERSQRHAKAKLQAKLEQHQEEEQRAWTRVRELEQQLDRQAAEIVTELAEGRNATLSAHQTQLTTQLSERESELADAVRAADESTARTEANVIQDERDAARAELEQLGADLDAATARASDAERSAQEHAERASELEARVSSLEDAAVRARATLDALRGELEDARRHAARSEDLEREVAASRGEADRLQAAVVALESEIRSTGQGQLGTLPNGSDQDLAAVSSALEGAREEMNALRRELELALASERRANLELVMLTAESQARLQAQTELKQAARESGLTQ